MSDIIYVVVSMNVKNWKYNVDTLYRCNPNNDYFSTTNICENILFWHFSSAEFYRDKEKAKCRAKGLRDTQKRMIANGDLIYSKCIYRVFALNRNFLDAFDD